MKWYWKVGGGHTHVRVFMNGGKCGDLCFRNEEFDVIKAREERDGLRWAPADRLIQFFPDEVPNHYPLSQVECRP